MRSLPGPTLLAVLGRVLAGVLGGVLAGVLVSGCGGGSEAGRPAAQILRDAQAAAEAADSVHITGTVVRGGATGPADTAHIDLVLTSSGDGREQISGSGAAVDVIRVGGSVYVKGLAAPGAGATGYRRLPVTDPQAAQLVGRLDMRSVFAQLIRTGDVPTVTGSGAVAGRPAVKITPGAGTGVIYVADDAAHPYPLQVESGASASTGTAGTLLFTDWNAHTVISPPTTPGS